jgi:hypothetical protein
MNCIAALKPDLACVARNYTGTWLRTDFSGTGVLALNFFHLKGV